jgi:outer membrane protein
MLFKLRTSFLFASVSFAVLLTSCNSSTEVTDSEVDSVSISKKMANDSISGVVIAYYIQDSISQGFNFYRKIDSILKAKEKEFEVTLRGKYEGYQKFEESVRKKMEAGEITGFQLDELQREAVAKQESIANYERQRGGELQQESMEYTTVLMNKISEAGREFSEENGIDLFFFYQKGGQITYISDAMDVTQQFINYLNKREDELMGDFEEDLENVEVPEEDIE